MVQDIRDSLGVFQEVVSLDQDVTLERIRSLLCLSLSLLCLPVDPWVLLSRGVCTVTKRSDNFHQSFSVPARIL